MVQDANKLVVFGSQLLGVLIVIAGLWTQQAKLQSPRPSGGRTPASASADRKGERFARLWDDPFPEGFENSVVKPRAGGPAPETIASPPPASQSPSPAKQSPTYKKLLIWNVLDARQVPEIKERRLRIRYAAVSAVLTADYLPARESSLSPLTEKPSETGTVPEGKELIGYFETFRAVPTCKAPFARVILAWTRKDAPLDEATIESVKKQIATKDEENGEVELQVLHHGSSQDLEDYEKSPQTHLAGKISFMRATIAGNKFDPFRPTISDHHLIDALFQELSLRIPALNRALPRIESRPRIVIVLERDTKYSYAIKQEIETKFQGVAKLEFSSYLRGLDGRSEDAASSTESAKSESDETSSTKPKGEGFGETSSGTSQFDYLRRLATRLGSETNSRKGRSVSAVGILGSDIYDKMLILQAMRDELRSAIFFTTDLDALYLERGNQHFTRNLIVAGGDGLDVNQNLLATPGSYVPPMRDGYQTVLANKVLSLLAPGDPKSATTPTPSVTPKIFEIAPGRNIDLKAGGPATSPNPKRNFVLRMLSFTWVNILAFAVGLANAFLILRAIFTRVAKSDTNQSDVVFAPMKPWWRVFVYTEVALALFAIGTLLFFLGWRKDALLLGEPLALGISIWPSVLIRLLAFLVAILLLMIASYTFVAQSMGLKKKLEAALPEGKMHLPNGMVSEGLRLCLSIARERPGELNESEFSSQLEKCFGVETRLLRNRRLWRIMGFSILYLALSMFLFWQWPPTVPARGAFALLYEKIVLALGVSLYIIHLIFCLDLHASAYNLLCALRALYTPAACKEIHDSDRQIDAKKMLEATASFTSIIGKTLLYPMTVLILIILSRLPHFDNWVMTPSLTITFLLGGLALVTAALLVWWAGSSLKKQVLAAHSKTEGVGEPVSLVGSPAASGVRSSEVAPQPAAGGGMDDAQVNRKRRVAFAKKREQLEAINEGVFAAWYNQPIFAAIFSAAAVFGSLSIAGPLARFMLE
ncbi:MAG: hypothetical protein QOH88_255 [Verrucomicrobiota bacterium]|jgi:hypothetical protein